MSIDEFEEPNRFVPNVINEMLAFGDLPLIKSATLETMGQ